MSANHETNPNLAYPQDLRALGFVHPGAIYHNRSQTELIELAIRRGEAELTADGALLAYTGERCGRSPQDRYIVREPSTEAHIGWGAVNRPIEPPLFERLLERVTGYFQSRPLFISDAFACADPRHRLKVRVVTEKAWHAVFARCLFLRPGLPDLDNFIPDWTIIAAADFQADPAHDGTRSNAFIILNFARKIVLIGGTHYAGEIKKSVFSILNYLLPERNVFPMHCSANIGLGGDVALFFGLSGTGKTTLSADPDRRLIGDDEHGWCDDGVFNIEGGCYAKTIRLSPTGEPQIWNAIRYGSVLENVSVNQRTRVPNYDDESITENTRAAYPIDFIPNCELSGRGTHPKNIFFLTCDAFGVLPPLARLTPAQAMYHFLSGYTAKVAGTEAGVTEPQATFSTCFGSPFLPLPPARYAHMLSERMQQHGAAVWLVNTGWTGGGFGVGNRMPIAVTRALLHAALDGQLDNVPTRIDPVFGIAVPTHCPDVPTELLTARATWARGDEYDAMAEKLAALFGENFKKYAEQAGPEVAAAGPRR